MDRSVTELLADHFFHCLIDREPSSVLDVGCGRGRLLAQCREAGIECHGVEPREDRVAELRKAGHQATVAGAEALPFGDGSFDWVTLRHVSHHLADVRPALAEAFRVAATGVVVAEPWLDESIPTQRVARRFDTWLEAQNTRVGHLHRAALAAGEFLAALPDGLEVSSRQYCKLVLAPRPDSWLGEQASHFTADLSEDSPALRELHAIEEAVAEVGLTYNGTMVLVMQRAGVETR